MTDRRRFLQQLAVGTAGLSMPGLAAAPLSAQRARGPQQSALNVLVLGGTGFLGPHIVNALVTRGHRVAILTRGQREPSLYEESYANVEHLIGDRAQPDGLNALRGRRWDVVLETSGYRHPWTRDAVEALRGSSDLYLYVSSTGVYWPYRTVDLAEDGPIPLVDDPPQEQPTYGVMKALSENEVRAGFPDGAIIVRPGYIVGPGDTSDRWTYWPVRIARGGEILVPGRRTDRVQYVDVRDLVDFMMRLIETRTTGTFNVVGPSGPQTLEEFVYGVAAITPVDKSWTWIEDYEFLKSYPLERAQDGTTSGLLAAVPWIMVEGDDLGHMRIRNDRAKAAGLTFRSLADTARDTLAWRMSDAVPPALRERPRYVLTPEQETAILEAWKRR